MPAAKSRALVARQKEIAIFREAETSPRSEFLAIYGRRRIGKTYLAEEHFKNRPSYFYFIGSLNTSTKEQLALFWDELHRSFKLNSPKSFDNWHEALSTLTDLIRKARKSKEKKVIFFDELPYLASRKSGFMEALAYFWNAHLKKMDDVILIVCGSAASWMIDHVVHNKGGLHNRLTRPAISLQPFTLKETLEYLKVVRQTSLNYDQVCEIYMVTGGVAWYLDQYNRGESANQFINRVFFNGPLRDEFDYLFSSLFDEHQKHLNAVTALGKHSEGLSREEVGKKMKLGSGRSLTQVLEELERSGFIRLITGVGKTKRGIYRLIDEYTLFYLTWLSSLGKSSTDQNYWQKQLGTARRNSWLGYAFQSLCFKHIAEIKKSLGVSAIASQEFGLRTKTAQIDMVIDRSDSVTNLCEMKYCQGSYNMNAVELKKIQNRKTELEKEIRSSIRRKRQIFVALVTTNPATRNKHYLSIVDSEVNLQNLFQ